MADTELIAAVRKLVKAKGRYHTEQTYLAVVAALDMHDFEARRSTSSVSEGEMPSEAQTAYKVAKGALIFGYYSERSDAEAIARQYAGAEVRVMVELAATKAAAPADAPKTVDMKGLIAYFDNLVPAEDARAEKNKASNCAGPEGSMCRHIDRCESLHSAPIAGERQAAEDAREEVQGLNTLEFRNLLDLWDSTTKDGEPEVMAKIIAYIRRASSVPAIPGTGGEKERAPDGWIALARVQGEPTSVAFRDEKTARAVCIEGEPFPFWREINNA